VVAFFLRCLAVPIIIIAMIGLACLIMPLLIPLGLVWMACSEVLDRWAAKRTPCPSCSHILGWDSLRIGREAHRLARRKFRRENFGVCVDGVPFHPAICVNCGADLHRSGGGFIYSKDILVWRRRDPTDDSGGPT
jgi:hypothetical protein